MHRVSKCCYESDSNKTPKATFGHFSNFVGYCPDNLWDFHTRYKKLREPEFAIHLLKASFNLERNSELQKTGSSTGSGSEIVD